MINGIHICTNPKCKGTMFQEIYTCQIVPPGDEEKSESGKVTMKLGHGKYFYRCVGCGKKVSFFKGEDEI